MAFPRIKELRSARRAEEGDKGFTLVELMVVVLVIAILLAIAIPTFLGARERSQDRAAQSNLRNALTAAKVAYSNDGNYASATHTTGHLDVIEPRLDYVASGTASATENQISVYVNTTDSCSSGIAAENTAALCTATGTWGTNTCTLSPSSNRRDGVGNQDWCTKGGVWGSNFTWAGAVWSDSETCWMLRDDTESKLTGTYYGDNQTQASCLGTEAAKITVTSGTDW